MNGGNKDRPDESRPVFTPTGVAITLTCAFLGLFLSFIGFTGDLFGWPVTGGVPKVTAFVILWITVVACCSRKAIGLRLSCNIPQRVKILICSLRKLVRSLIALWAILALVLAISTFAFTEGVPDSHPVFAHRTNYVLNNHGTKVQVTEFRYHIVGIAFSFFFNLSYGCVFLACIYYLCCGNWLFIDERPVQKFPGQK